jgi:outer membrane protein OmpA-like peptidoglycan-associated protein
MRHLLLPMLMLLHGCAGPGPGALETPPPSPKPAAPVRPAAVAVERQWLQSWFKDTPVRIEQRSASAFQIEVPREFCFDIGRSEIKPPLAAVLDKLAQSLQRKPELRVEQLAAPADVAMAPALAQQRAENVRRQLLERGVSSSRLAAPGVAPVPALQLRIGLAAP